MPCAYTTWDYLNGCVHFNSGVLNKLAYLISEGGEHKGQTVAGIGRQKLARIAYRALTTKLNATSSLVHAAENALRLGMHGFGWRCRRHHGAGLR